MNGPAPLRLRRLLSTAAVLIGLAAADPAPAEDPAPAADWPQFLGPHRSGAVEDSVAVWPAGGPAMLWRRPAGDGFSGIAVAGGRAWTLWTEDRREYLFCLDAADGRELWRLDTGGKYFEPQGGNGPRSTPSVVGDHVYALGATGRLVAAKRGQRGGCSGASTCRPSSAARCRAGGSPAPRWWRGTCCWWRPPGGPTAPWAP